MNLAEKLARDFSFMRARPENNKGSYICDLYSAFGCECGEGWYQLLHNLCRELLTLFDKNNVDAEQFRVLQVKEKFGALRFYYSVSLLPEDLHTEIRRIINKYENISKTTCERCGQPGKLMGDHWISVRCDACREEQNKP